MRTSVKCLNTQIVSEIQVFKINCNIEGTFESDNKLLIDRPCKFFV